MKNNIRYDEHTKKIIIPIPDPNVCNEVKNYIQQNGGYSEAVIGSDAIKIRLEYLIYMFYTFLGDNDQKKFEKEIKKHTKKTDSKNYIMTTNDKFEMLNNILNLTNNATNIIANTIGSYICVFSPLIIKAFKLAGHIT